MSISATEQRHNQQMYATSVVDYHAINRPARARPSTHTVQKTADNVVGVPIGLIRVGSAVICRDGMAGRVADVVVHPHGGYPTHIVVQQGRLQPRQFRVAFNRVSGITPDYVELNLSQLDLVQQLEYCPDDEIAEVIEAAFHGAEAFHDHGDYLAIRVTVKDGTVTLRGNVRNSARRLDAVQIVKRMRGVIAVENILFSDAEIEWNTAWVLQRDPRLQTRNLRVETCLGLVRLHGKIASVSQRALAAIIAKQVPGVHAINNGLIVDPALALVTEAATINPSQQVEEMLVV